MEREFIDFDLQLSNFLDKRPIVEKSFDKNRMVRKN
jgi:hypothetical protein